MNWMTRLGATAQKRLALRIPDPREKRIGIASALLCVLCVSVALAGCGAAKVDFERGSWIVIRDADAALDQMVNAYEHWKGPGQPFTPAELERFRVALFAGNEVLATAEASHTAYRAVKNGTQAGSLAAQQAALESALESLKRAVAAAREIFSALEKRVAKNHGELPLMLAAVNAAQLFLLLSAMLGDFAYAVIGGKKGAITQAALAVVAAVMSAHKEATGEDIDLAAAQVRARIDDRRKRLAKP